MAVFIKQVNIPQKSDLINIDMTGSGTAQTYRVLKNVSDQIVEVLGMTNLIARAFDTGGTNTYENKTLDTYLNTTWYSTLSNTAKLAIVDKTFRQDSWYLNNSGDPDYITHLNERTWSLGSATYGNNITRHIYALSVQDIIDYVDATTEMTYGDSTITSDNLMTMFFNATTSLGSQFVQLRSAKAGTTSSNLIVVSTTKNVIDTGSNDDYLRYARPAFQIDLSKIDYTFTDGRSLVELKPVSILQKSNNTLSRVGMSWKIPTYPVKSDIVDIDMTGSGTPQQYRVLKVNGSVAEVLSMSDATSIAFDSDGTYTYEGKTLDTYLNTTWYNTLSETAKTAIVDKTFTQDSWYRNNTGNPIYEGKQSGDTAYQVSLNNASFGNEITRHAYAISVQDVLDYLEVTPQLTQTNTTLTYTNIWQMFWNDSVTHSGQQIWLRSAYASSSASRAFIVHGSAGFLDYLIASSQRIVRPALTIDLSKIDFTIE